jgi:cytochrome P450
MQPSLPPGPRLPTALQGVGWWTRPTAFIEKCRARYGKKFTIRLPFLGPSVIISDPDVIKEIFQAPPEVLHPGEGARVLEPVVGPHSVILLDEKPHLEQRKLMLPAFHGQKMQELEGLITELAEREVESWPRDQRFSVHARMQKLTLEVILRAVFGVDEGERLETMRDQLTQLAAFATRPEGMLPSQLQDRLVVLGGRYAYYDRLFNEFNDDLYSLIRERRASDGEDRPDVMAMFLAARHEDGSPMSDDEVRDELMTMMVAGHETTASQLAWIFDVLPREPRVLATLTSELDSGNGDEYLTAVINETMRRRPVLQNAEPRLTKEPVTIGGWTYPEDVSLVCSAYLVHHDPEIYPDPYAFRPERFLEEPPGTYTLIPFGGGRRRCIGASFANMEMKIVLKAALERLDLHAVTSRPEIPRRRSITISPRHGAPVRVTERVREPVAA